MRLCRSRGEPGGVRTETNNLDAFHGGSLGVRLFLRRSLHHLNSQADPRHRFIASLWSTRLLSALMRA